MIKVGMISLGCAKNLVDSEMVLGMLKQSGFEICNTIEESDVIIINTCGFIESSKQESIENILDVVSYHKKTIVIGCLVQRYLEELKKSIPEVDAWVKIDSYKDLNKVIKEVMHSDDIIEISPFNRMLSTPSFMAYLRISEGCNNCCTYCAIPLIRGRFRSRPFKDVLYEAKLLADSDIKELVLISQDTTRYGSDLEGDITIVTLLDEIVKMNAFKSIRLLYLYPDEISDELIEYISKHKDVIAPYFDIPFQHSSDPLLKRMNRRGTKKEYMDLIHRIREKIPNAILRTTYIVGFPGETLDDFNDLIDFTREVECDHMVAFKYSREDGTASYKFKNQVKDEEKARRYNSIMQIQKSISYHKNKEHINEVMHGFVIGFDPKANQYQLRSYWNAPDDIDGNIFFSSDKTHQIGDEVDVKIESVFVYDLYGKEVL